MVQFTSLVVQVMLNKWLGLFVNKSLNHGLSFGSKFFTHIKINASRTLSGD